ncbi:glycosyl hydrolase family 28-related protein [Thalassotalea sp. PLHSN55]|uniref:glycosyl hydrolase family 28-related protein n=1 Tax=Thalassotalea sp. PLHSN55 TaxID=3435888 RepID=UPI003F8427BF
MHLNANLNVTHKRYRHGQFMGVLTLIVALSTLVLPSFSASAKERTANKDNIAQIQAWATDNETTKITFPAGTYLFSTSLVISNTNLTLVGSGKNNTVLKLTQDSKALIDAQGNKITVTDMTLNGNNKLKVFGQPIFKFNKSKNHRFERVLFKRSEQFGISATVGYALDGLYVSDCEFEDIKGIVINILNRNTEKRNGTLVTSVSTVTVKDSLFKQGYLIGITLDAGNDRRDETVVDGKKVGRRYVETVDLNDSAFSSNTFEKTRKFHFAGVQASGFKLAQNTFAGMTDDAESGANSLHFEQFTTDVKIYNNTFSMSNTVAKAYPYMLFSGTEGHKRVFQKKASSTYESWTYYYEGGNERRADTSCASSGDTDKNCKRDVHAYGPKGIYIAGNTFNDSTKISKYLLVHEGENIRVGTEKNGVVNLNSFNGGNNSTKKISFGGHDEGTCDVKILAGQGIVNNNVSIAGVDFSLPACKIAKPIAIGI